MAGAGTVGSLQVIKNGRIRSVRYSAKTNAAVAYSATFQVVRNTGTPPGLLNNVTNSPIVDAVAYAQLAATAVGVSAGACLNHQSMLDVDVQAGETLYVLYDLDSGGDMDVVVFIDVQ